MTQVLRGSAVRRQLTQTDATPRPEQTRELLRDGGFLAALVVVSTLPYVFDLGFYSDDWSFLSALHNADDRSVRGLVSVQMANENLVMRPTQALYQALLYRAFELAPLGYHLVNTLVQAALAVVLYALIRGLRQPRLMAVAAVAVFAVLPHAATNRFWFASFGYALSLLLAAASLLVDLRAAATAGRGWVGWKLVALLLLVAAGMGYEVVLPVLAGGVLVIWWQHRRAWPGRLGGVRALLFVGSNLAALVAIGAYKAAVGVGAGLPAGMLPYHLSYLLVDGAAINFGLHGVLQPWSAGWAVTRLPAATVLLAGGTSVAVAVYLAWLAAGEGWPSPRAWLRLAVAGGAVYLLGYAIFAFTSRIWISGTGIANRTSAAATVGVALLMVAGVGLPVSVLARRRRGGVFAVAVAAVVLCGFLVNSALAGYWVTAWARQEQTLARVDRVAASLPADATVILDGVCPYEGPAIVFESHWDFAGALQTRYQRPDLRGDVTRQLTVLDEGIRTQTYSMTADHEYGPRLLLLDASEGGLVPLSGPDTAREHLGGEQPPAPAGCDPGSPGHGALSLPGDELSRRVAARLRGLLTPR